MTEFGAQSGISPEQRARIQVLKLGNQLIDRVADGPFQFAGNWTARPMTDESGESTPDGAVYEQDRLGFDYLNRAELERHGNANLDVRITTVRPNANTRTTKIMESKVTLDEDSHIGEHRWSDILGEGFVTGTIDELHGYLSELDELTSIPPAPPKQGFWRSMFLRIIRR